MSRKQIFWGKYLCVEPELRSLFLTERILCWEEEKSSEENIYCEQPDLLSLLLTGNILCQQQKYSEENIFCS